MGRGWYRRRHVDRDVCGHPGANPGGRFTLHILRGLNVITPPWAPPTKAFLICHSDEN
jgi:hypothetical protein